MNAPLAEIMSVATGSIAAPKRAKMSA